MKFTDYTPDELIGKTVIISNRHRMFLTKIEKVNKWSFKTASGDNLYNLNNGNKRGNDGWNHSSAQLITEERANKYRKEWKDEENRLKAIDTIQLTLKELPLDILNNIVSLLPKKD